MKKILIKTGEYESDEGTKNRYTQLGIVKDNQHGEYLLLDPTINLAGCLLKQNLLNNNICLTGKFLRFLHNLQSANKYSLFLLIF